jgi:hypothetical protein
MSYDKPFTSKSEDVTALFTLLVNVTGQIETLEEERKDIIHRL